MKKYRKVFSLILVVFMFAAMFSACSKDSKFVGTWYELDENGERTGETLVLAGDGTGSATDDGMSGSVTWSVDGKVFTMSVSICGMTEAYTGNYKFSGKKLTLSMDDGTVLYYEKA